MKLDKKIKQANDLLNKEKAAGSGLTFKHYQSENLWGFQVDKSIF